MENDLIANDEPFFTADFGKAIAKTLIINVVSTAGVLAGFAAVGFVVSKVQDRNKSKAENETTTETTPTQN